MKIENIGDINSLYTEDESAHSSLHAEQRSNILLVAGNHYNKRNSAFYNSLRSNTQISKQQKIRLVKNHIQKITKTYLNNILNAAPGTTIVPKNQAEFHDQKVAELHESVWADLKDRLDYERTRFLLAKDFVEIGECWLKVFFDPMKGQFLGYEPQYDEQGNLVELEGEIQAKALFTGDLVWDRIHGFNVMTDSSARSWEESRHVWIRKMVPTKDLKSQFAGDDEKLAYIGESSKQTWMLFDSSSSSYKSDPSGQTLVRELYVRPCSDYPNGYYYITTDAGILYEGELPQGLFPIIHVGFDEASTSARSFSIIKQLRPYQAEINRAASKIAEHQVTLGDDKLVTQVGATLTQGASVHGIRHIKSAGPVTHIPGRAGDQYADYLSNQISEMYMIANVEEDGMDKAATNPDPYALLFRSMKDKKRFSLYAEKFENFLKKWTLLSLRNAKANYRDDMLVHVVGKKEIVNIPEFRSSDDLSWEISVMSQTEDVESRLGQQLSLNNILQFTGSKLEPEQIGQLVRNMPFLNKEEIFSDLLLDYDNVRSDILAMDRGEFVPPGPQDNHDYYIKKLSHRMKMKDFQFLPPFVQSNYQIKKAQHEQIFLQQQKDAAELEAGFIPSGGGLIKCDLRIQDPLDPTKSQILKLPVESINWLVDRLEKQGTMQALMGDLPLEAQAQMGVAMNGEQTNSQQMAI